MNPRGTLFMLVLLAGLGAFWASMTSRAPRFARKPRRRKSASFLDSSPEICNPCVWLIPRTRMALRF